MTRGFIGAFVDGRTFRYKLELLQLEVATTYLVAHSGSRLGLRLESTMRSGFGHPSPTPFGLYLPTRSFEDNNRLTHDPTDWGGPNLIKSEGPYTAVNKARKH